MQQLRLVGNPNLGWSAALRRLLLCRSASTGEATSIEELNHYQRNMFFHDRSCAIPPKDSLAQPCVKTCAERSLQGPSRAKIQQWPEKKRFKVLLALVSESERRK